MQTLKRNLKKKMISRLWVCFSPIVLCVFFGTTLFVYTICFLDYGKVKAKCASVSSIEALNNPENNCNEINLALIFKDPKTGSLPLNFVAVLNPGKKECEVIFIPSNTRVLVSDNNHWKHIRWDSLHRKGVSHNEIVHHMEELTSIKIDHYVLINLKGFEKIIDEINGVHLHVTCSIQLADLKLGTGRHKLTGNETLKLFTASLPHNLTQSEKIIRSLLQSSYKATSGELLPSLLWIGINNSSTNMALRDIWNLHNKAKNIPSKQVYLSIWKP